jgi:hypothetical protein
MAVCLADVCLHYVVPPISHGWKREYDEMADTKYPLKRSGVWCMRCRLPRVRAPEAIGGAGPLVLPARYTGARWGALAQRDGQGCGHRPRGDVPAYS